jgi:AcrR family transcriptional regulator
LDTVTIAAGNKPDLRARKKKETRRLILKCANALFHERGYAATTLEDIADRAGVHKQTVLRYFGSKEGIALAFRQIALQKFKTGLLDPARTVPVMEYWRSFVEESAREVTERGDIVRYTKLVESEPGLMGASLAIQIQYEEILATEFSREAGLNPSTDLESRFLAAFLVAGYFSVARHLLGRGELRNYVRTALYVVDFAIQKFPRQANPNLRQEAPRKNSRQSEGWRSVPIPVKTVTG